MRTKPLFVVGLAALLSLALGVGVGLGLGLGADQQFQAEQLAPIRTAFTYQGQLEGDGQPVDGQYDFEFALYDQGDGGAMLGSPQTIADVLVSDGLFTALVDVDPSHLNGERRFLQVGVRPSDGGAFSPLTPRHELTAAPYAIYAVQAGQLSISGTLGMRLELPTGGGVPSVVGGSAGNLVDGDAEGAVIRGGQANYAPGHWSALGGGLSNQALSIGGTVGGGVGNIVVSDTATIGGGYLNVATASGAAIAGGHHLTATGQYAALGGGYHNQADGWSSVVAGGHTNQAFDRSATLSGGEANWALGTWSTVGGGGYNTSQTAFSTVPGGLGAMTQAFGQWAYASGVFDQLGDAQASLNVLRGSTDGDIFYTELFLDGAGERIHLTGQTAMTFDILLVGRSAPDQGSWYWAGKHITGTVAVGPGGVIQVDQGQRGFGDETGSVRLIPEADRLKLHVEQATAFDGQVRWVAVVWASFVAW
jgi:hypothetical protein